MLCLKFNFLLAISQRTLYHLPLISAENLMQNITHNYCVSIYPKTDMELFLLWGFLTVLWFVSLFNTSWNLKHEYCELHLYKLSSGSVPSIEVNGNLYPFQLQKNWILAPMFPFAFSKYFILLSTLCIDHHFFM